jgi:hypothetical protein
MEAACSVATMAVWDPRMRKDHPKLYYHRASAAALLR